MQHIIFSILILIFSHAWAETPLSQSDLANELKNYQGIKSLKARFDQTRRIEKWQTDIQTSGSFSFDTHQGQTILWEIQKPEYSAIKISSQGMAMNANSKSPQWKSVNNPQITNQIEPLFSWLHFDAKKISQDYEVFLVAKETFKLIPKNKSSLKSITILGDNGKIQQVILKEQTDDTIDIRFSKVKIQQ